jgi:hypothetical protein
MSRLSNVFDQRVERTRREQETQQRGLIDGKVVRVAAEGTALVTHSPPPPKRGLQVVSHPLVTVPATAILVAGIMWAFLRPPVAAVNHREPVATIKDYQFQDDGELLVTGRVVSSRPGDELYLFIERDSLCWPKESPLDVEGDAWESMLTNQSADKAGFKLSLWSVSPQGVKAIHQWLERSRQTGDYRGLLRVPGATMLDAVKVSSRN